MIWLKKIIIFIPAKSAGLLTKKRNGLKDATHSAGRIKAAMSRTSLKHRAYLGS